MTTELTTLQSVLNSYNSSDNKSQLINELRKALYEILDKEGEVCSDDISHLVPSGINRNVLGALFSTEHRRGRIQILDFKPSVIPTNHSHRIAVWGYPEVQESEKET